MKNLELTMKELVYLHTLLEFEYKYRIETESIGYVVENILEKIEKIIDDEFFLGDKK